MKRLQKTTLDTFCFRMLKKKKRFVFGFPVSDRFKAQCTFSILSLLDDNNICLVIVPPNCTDRLQPLDVSVNKSAKEFIRKQFQQWYADEVCKQLEKGKEFKAVDLKMAIVKPLSVKWLTGLYQYLRSNPDIIVNGFKHLFFE